MVMRVVMRVVMIMVVPGVVTVFVCGC